MISFPFINSLRLANPICKIFLDLCSRLGVPVAPHKTLGPIPRSAIGFNLETLSMKKITLRELRSIIGKLQFSTIVVPHGTAFLRWLHDLTIGINKPFHLYVYLRALNCTSSIRLVFFPFLLWENHHTRNSRYGLA